MFGYKENEIECINEYSGAYDGWLSFRIKGEDFDRHRINGEKIIGQMVEYEYGPMQFYMEDGSYFINLRKIYDGI